MTIKIKSIIFDMDGVLIDAKDWHYEALNKALKLFGMEISRRDHLVTYDGLPTNIKLKMISDEKGLPISLHNFIHEMKQRYTNDCIHTQCKPTFFHQYALNRLRSDGYMMAVCSNSISPTIELMLTKSDIKGYFDFFLSSDDVKKPKPNPEIYNMAIKKLNLKPDECLIIEDNVNGINAANDSGAHCMAIQDISQVNYTNIKNYITKLEA